MGEINDFDDGEFYGFASIPNKDKRKSKKKYRKKLKVLNIYHFDLRGRY